jgi:hypothetical protein
MTRMSARVLYVDIPPGDGFPGGGVGLLFLTGFFFFVGIALFVGAYRRHCEPETTVDGEPGAGLGSRGGVVARVVLGVILVALGVALVVFASGSGGPRRHGAPIPGVSD